MDSVQDKIASSWLQVYLYITTQTLLIWRRMPVFGTLYLIYLISLPVLQLQETVKRKLESAGSPLGHEQVNGFVKSYPPPKKSCLEKPPPSPLDTKHPVNPDLLAGAGGGGGGGMEPNGRRLPGELDVRLKEPKQEPMDDILPASGAGGNIILPDLNLNEQEWTELMEEFNRSVPYEEIQDLFNDGFEDRKEPDLTPGPVAPTSLLPDLTGTVKAEFSPAPASAAFEQDPRTGSPQVPGNSSAPQMHAGSPIMPAASSSPALPGHQHAQQPAQPRTLQNHLMPPKDLSPAQQLQQLAAREKHRAQLLHNQQHQVQRKALIYIYNNIINNSL